jgi:AcrR family transcriptional regulator
MPKQSSREKVLDAYEEILIEHGSGAVTLEAVAARAGVSKGGLLYHFGSKDALVEGLIGRIGQLAEIDMETAKKAPEGVVDYYLHSSVTDISDNVAMHRTTMASMRLVGSEPRIDAAMRAYTHSWRLLLNEYIADPVTAEIVGVIGDGLYFRASLGEPRSPLLDTLTDFVARLSQP